MNKEGKELLEIVFAIWLTAVLIIATVWVSTWAFSQLQVDEEVSVEATPLVRTVQKTETTYKQKVFDDCDEEGKFDMDLLTPDGIYTRTRYYCHETVPYKEACLEIESEFMSGFCKKLKFEGKI